MLRMLARGLLVVGCLATLSCQTYTTEMTGGAARADEGAATANMRAIGRAQTAYNISNPGDYATFEQLAAGGYLDGRFNTSKPKYYGYVFTMSVTPKSESTAGSFALNGDPDPELKAAGRHFYLASDSTGIHVNASRPASASDPIEGP